MLPQDMREKVVAEHGEDFARGMECCIDTCDAVAVQDWQKVNVAQGTMDPDNDKMVDGYSFAFWIYVKHSGMSEAEAAAFHTCVAQHIQKGSGAQ